MNSRAFTDIDPRVRERDVLARHGIARLVYDNDELPNKPPPAADPRQMATIVESDVEGVVMTRGLADDDGSGVGEEEVESENGTELRRQRTVYISV